MQKAKPGGIIGWVDLREINDKNCAIVQITATISTGSKQLITDQQQFGYKLLAVGEGVKFMQDVERAVGCELEDNVSSIVGHSIEAAVWPLDEPAHRLVAFGRTVLIVQNGKRCGAGRNDAPEPDEAQEQQGKGPQANRDLFHECVFLSKNICVPAGSGPGLFLAAKSVQ